MKEVLIPHGQNASVDCMCRSNSMESECIKSGKLSNGMASMTTDQSATQNILDISTKLLPLCSPAISCLSILVVGVRVWHVLWCGWWAGPVTLAGLYVCMCHVPDWSTLPRQCQGGNHTAGQIVTKITFLIFVECCLNEREMFSFHWHSYSCSENVKTWKRENVHLFTWLDSTYIHKHVIITFHLPDTT